MKGITVNPEWGFAITHMDKRIENRTWRPFINVINQRVAIHAGARIGGKEGWKGEPFNRVAECAKQAGWNIHRFYQQGKILCFDFEKDGKIVSLTEDNVVKKAIVAVARISGSSESTIKEMPPWGINGYKHWHLTELEILPEPIDFSGFQGFWDIPKQIEEQIENQLQGKEYQIIDSKNVGIPDKCTRCGNPPTERDEGKLTQWGDSWNEWLCEHCLLRPDDEYKEWARWMVYNHSFIGSSAYEIECIADEVSLTDDERKRINEYSVMSNGLKKTRWQDLFFKKTL